MYWSRRVPESVVRPRASASLLAALLYFACAGVQAQPDSSGPTDGKPWMLVIAALTDEDSFEHLLAGFHLGLSDATWLSLTAGSSSAPASESDVDTKLLRAGIEHDFGAVGLALNYRDWGDSGDLESTDWQGEVFFDTERARVALLLEQRDIDVFYTVGGDIIAPRTRRFPLAADGFGIRGRFRISDNWQLYGSWMDYDYPARLRVVPRAERVNLLSNSTLTLAYGFVDEYVSLGVERAVGDILLNLDLGSDRSAIDGSRLKSVSAAVLLPVAARLDLELQLGSSRVEGRPSSLYGGVSLMLYGG